VAARQALQTSMKRAYDVRHRSLEAAVTKLGALSPLKVLDRGFSLTQRADGHLVTSVAQVAPGEAITVRLREGTLDAEVRKLVDPENET
jgi:exodeoxyribonuclease VII large subunit